MRILLILLASALCLSAQQGFRSPGFLTRLLTKTAVPDVGCSGGSWLSGYTERFEQGIDAFCTTGWTLNETNTLDVFSDLQNLTLGHSMMYTNDGTGVPPTGTIRQTVNLSSFTIRFYFKTINFLDVETNTRQHFFMGDTTTSALADFPISLRLQRTSGGIIALIVDGDEANTHTSGITDDTWYRAEFKYVRNGTGAIQMFSIGGTPLASETTITCADVDVPYIHFGNLSFSHDTDTPWSVHFDNIKLDTGSSWPVGADE